MKHKWVFLDEGNDKKLSKCKNEKNLNHKLVALLLQAQPNAKKNCKNNQ
jgi:hypothetical protein